MEKTLHKLRPECTRSRHFEIQNRKIFGEGALPPHSPVADPGFPNGGAKDEAPQAPRSSRHRREDRGAEGAEVCGEGVSPSPLGEGAVPPPHWGRGLCPLPRNFFDFSSEKE